MYAGFNKSEIASLTLKMMVDVNQHTVCLIWVIVHEERIVFVTLRSDQYRQRAHLVLSAFAVSNTRLSFFHSCISLVLLLLLGARCVKLNVMNREEGKDLTRERSGKAAHGLLLKVK